MEYNESDFFALFISICVLLFLASCVSYGKLSTVEGSVITPFFCYFNHSKTSWLGMAALI